MHNTLIASGPDFKSAFVDEAASGNIDVAPTILWILGITPKTKMVILSSPNNPTGGVIPPDEYERIAASLDAKEELDDLLSSEVKLPS